MADEKSFQYVKIMLPLFRAVVESEDVYMWCLSTKVEKRILHCTLKEVPPFLSGLFHALLENSVKVFSDYSSHE